MHIRRRKAVKSVCGKSSAFINGSVKLSVHIRISTSRHSSDVSRVFRNKALTGGQANGLLNNKPRVTII